MLLAAPPSLHVPTDHFIFTPHVSPTAAKLNRYQIVPFVCIQDEYMGEKRIGFESIISPGKRVALPTAKRPSCFSLVRRHRKMTIQFRR
jgi:glycosyl transferase, family 25